MVGAIVLDSAGVEVGSGWHRKFGGPHAEVHALEEAGERARGGTLIVTLEPCCHWGKTPPCAEAVIRAGITRVVAAMADPFPRVAGGGLKLLRDTGVEVEVGLCEGEARRLNAPYLKLLKTGLPWVHLKWAMTLDGKIATATGDSRWISSEESRRKVHELRGYMDAIAVGRATVVADDPLLTARPPGPRVPARIVITASGDLPERCKLRETAREFPTIVFTSPDGGAKLVGWKRDGAEVLGISSDGNRLSLPDVLQELGRRRFTNVLVEGGAGLLGSFADAGLADEFHAFIAPKIIGGEAARSAFGGRGVAKMADAWKIEAFSALPSGDDVYLHGFSATTFL
jgi:diaminohydroxyphosphoribosylaminopyrimidine deaminase/5-amino-6-(5-phosphoribosylamino)uracil reductase